MGEGERYRVREATEYVDDVPYLALRRVWWVWDTQTQRTVGEWFPTHTDAVRHARVLNAHAALLPPPGAGDVVAEPQ